MSEYIDSVDSVPIEQLSITYEGIRTDQDICTPCFWYKLFSKRLMKSRFLDLENNFLEYLLADGLVLPQGTHIHGLSGDGQLSDDEELTESSAAASEAPSFPALTAAIDRAIAELGGKVFVKINWMSAQDAAWVNGGLTVCHTAGDIYLLLKASDKISAVASSLLTMTAGSGSGSEAGAAVGPPTLGLIKWANFFPSMEFRCFVKNKRLVGLCQRHCSTHFEFLSAEMEWIEDKVVEVFHSAVKETFPLHSYVFDIYIDKQKRVWFVDFNIFGAPTNPLLFDWSDFDDTPDDVEAPRTTDGGRKSNKEDGDNDDGSGDESDGMESGVQVRTVMTSADLLPHVAGQSRGPTDVIDHQAQLSAVMNLSMAQLQRMHNNKSDSSDSDDGSDKEGAS